MCIIRVGTILEALINLLTLGHGKSLAGAIATKLGYVDCGCDRRREYLDALFGCHSGIKL
jgi:hypothetical protein